MSRFLKLLILRYLPHLSKIAFRAKRLKEDKEYWSTFVSSKEVTAGETNDAIQPRLLIMLPQDYNLETPFAPAAGNYNYEIAQSAEERYGVGATEVYFPTQESDWVIECRTIAEKVQKTQITHLLFYIESIEIQSGLWRWDILAAELARTASSVTALGFLTDGTYELHQVQCRSFQEIYSRSLFLQIDVMPGTKYLPNGRLVGPTFLPISLESINRLREYLSQSDSEDTYELSFVGKMYGYRKKIVRKLLASGVQVSINPQATSDSGIKAGYLDYMSALSRSKYTINFARANGTRQKQLKSRVLESVLVGSIPVTDDNGLTGRILPTTVPFVNFRRPHEIAEILGQNSFGESPSFGIVHGSKLEKEEIGLLAYGHFWKTLEEGLSMAGLPLLVQASDTP